MHLAEIPIEVLLDHLLLFLPTASLLRLASTNRSFANICADDTLWKKKLLIDFNFSGKDSARTSGWKFIYRGLANPKVFVWGETSHGRLGVPKPPSASTRGLPFPIQLRIPGARIVSIVAGGMSFHALDSTGSIYVWGTLDGTAFGGNGFSEPGKASPKPLRLEMPAPTRDISCGRLHASSLDSDGRVWTFTSWGRPFYLTSPLLSGPLSIPLRVVCGWNFSCLLTKSGEIFVWWPFSGRMRDSIQRKNDEMDGQENMDAQANESEGTIPCCTWELKQDPTQLPPLPPLPLLPPLSDEIPAQDGEMKIIQVAALEAYLIGLTNHGHVLKFGPFDETSLSRGSWQYLPLFSEPAKVREHPTFNKDASLTPPPEMKITHISGNFLHFTAYSTGINSVVLMGDTETTAESSPNIIPALQNKSIISVVLGDYHYAALTSKGKLLTWGAYSSGALGLGDPARLQPGMPGAFRDQRTHQAAGIWDTPPAVATPTEVRFDHGRKKPREMFCFSAAASGWHTGALVIDLEVISEFPTLGPEVYHGQT
ncbi:regulator of chromosome condensation 1/beta-lactamase-inhibitor protein II [Infundibulicybe gibba]|nr:regulator of chromosome condensation 1/beta-lactamase-inhibitor protein II [Infundibulicybe gibba]